MTKKAIITDYNRLPWDIESTWIVKYFGEDYLIYDKYHRFPENENVKHSPDVGVNIYDLFNFTYENYDNLPDICFFCKDDVIGRHCSVEKFEKILTNEEFTPIENYIRNTPHYHPGIYAYVTENDEYYESYREINYVAGIQYPCKYVFSYRDLISEIFESPSFEDYIRFAPGANYIIPKKTLLKFNKDFYLRMREIVSWCERPGEAYILERAICTIFDSPFEIKQKYRI
jgi:hypothetical protein